MSAAPRNDSAKIVKIYKKSDAGILKYYGIHVYNDLGDIICRVEKCLYFCGIININDLESKPIAPHPQWGVFFRQRAKGCSL